MGLARPRGEGTLDLRLAPTAWKPGAGLWFRAQLAAWRGDVVLARAKRYVRAVAAGIPVVLEVHELDSALAEERGGDPGPWRALEQATLLRARGLIANAEGTLALWEQAYPEALPPVRAVVHNGTRVRPEDVARGRQARVPGALRRVFWAGSPVHEKGLRTVLPSVRGWPDDVELVLLGGAPPGVGLPPRVRALPPVPPHAVAAALGAADALLLSLSDDLFGRALTSPLKLWDYLAAGLPIVAPDLPTVRAVVRAGDAHLHRVGDPGDLSRAVLRALAAPSPAPRVRSWADRAAEVEAVLLRCLGLPGTRASDA
jgi:glycosyltransferase involved in cell wall biosynthesis